MNIHGLKRKQHNVTKQMSYHMDKRPTNFHHIDKLKTAHYNLKVKIQEQRKKVKK